MIPDLQEGLLSHQYKLTFKYISQKDHYLEHIKAPAGNNTSEQETP